MNTKWKKVAIAQNDTVLSALKLINDEPLKVVLVVDENDGLLGVVTDGDIRRGLLNNLQLSDPVSLVMNAEPIIASLNASSDELRNLMESSGVLMIPIIDDGKVVGLETLHHLLAKPKYDNPVFIMAGGFGTRLKPLTDDCPKPMLKVGKKPILETVLESFIKAGFVNFYISTHYMPEKIHQHFGKGEKWGINIEYIHEESPLGTGGALGLLPPDLPDLPIIMMNGDVLTKVDFGHLLAFHNESTGDATMCVREYEYQIPYGVVKGEKNRVVSMVEKPIQRFFVNAGIYVVSANIVKSIPRDYVIDMPTLLENKMAEGGDVLMFPVHEYWLDIGQMDDFKRAQSDILSLGFD
ncbi:nucleotidyltransferase family protein [Neptuniibacter pectenicola]|uniref:nucleotidyltransferase family protein n=1 Tax=Neptuniibacter pectenicola TaxID=1806669 RepID=UPI0008343377|nr:nucleotidyltransferase family protein [Neptuniibacter pectenicola]